MTQLGLLLFLLTGPVLHEARSAQPGAYPLPQVRDPCTAAKRIVAQRPCLRPEDCGAFRSWQRLFGAPRIEPLDPQFAVLAASRVDVPTSYLCLAASVEPRARRPAPR